jgi:hypothetical protein
MVDTTGNDAVTRSGANSWYGRANSAVLRGFSSPKHRIPDCRRNSALNAQPSECELAFADAMHHFDASNRVKRSEVDTVALVKLQIPGDGAMTREFLFA